MQVGGVGSTKRGRKRQLVNDRQSEKEETNEMTRAGARFVVGELAAVAGDAGVLASVNLFAIRQ